MLYYYIIGQEDFANVITPQLRIPMVLKLTRLADSVSISHKPNRRFRARTSSLKFTVSEL